MLGYLNNFLGGAVIAFILSNLMNFIEVLMIMRVIKDIKKVSDDTKRMLLQFKSEGEDGEWLK